MFISEALELSPAQQEKLLSSCGHLSPQDQLRGSMSLKQFLELIQIQIEENGIKRETDFVRNLVTRMEELSLPRSNFDARLDSALAAPIESNLSN